ncbi:uncharacterized protein Z520_12203 [Fonsecaea multimorphosa CBS 102226]|uniref:Uncharacterized protein n=1 Tax=Fonsecaea multimorphosa CBS 102226 TaxID=1442371 RepID=A0A0D2JNQ1_9EURO|nr:uncharacterized protein Z520_12203 [Fonsecaea multimorphosa CBS 102226]KIX92119.1 hypothetical protein Z520_12203 [Fonsecaea multimorphosa CBS 102226]OAL17482.1 hypothetical protein AYO22_11614 [Fonsecaea multimorphosa]
MPSSVTFSASTANTKSASQSIYTRPPQKKQKMSITQTYFLAHSARGKLSREAARPDHDLRLLVGHANMLDSLMLDLANAEQEQERWFNNIVNGSQQEEEEERHRHVETIVEEPEADWEPEDAASSEEESEDETEQKPDTQVTAIEVDSDMEDDDDDNEDLTLVRTASRHSPPELSLDTDSDSEDEHMPPSPPTTTIQVLSEKQRQAIATTSFYDAKDTASLSPEESEAFEEEGFYLPSRQQPTIIAAY